MKTSIFTIVFGQRSLDEAIKLASEIGYDGVELWGQEEHFSCNTSLKRAKEIKKMLIEYQIEVSAIGSYLGEFSTSSDEQCKKSLEDLEKYFELMDILDCDLIRVNCGGPHIFLADRYHYYKSLWWMDKCSKIAKQSNKKIAMEIHNGSLIETVEMADEFLKELNKENVGVIHDAANMYITDTDYGLQSVDTLIDKIFHVHVKDVQRVSDDSLPDVFRSKTVYGDELFQHRMLGEGAVDHVPVFKGLLKNGYNGFVSCESHVSLIDMEKAKRELAEIKNQIKIAHDALKEQK